VNNKFSRFIGAQQRLAAALLAIFLITSIAVSQQATAVAPANSLSATEQQLVNSLKVETIREVVTALSADDMEGRGTGQPGGDKAATYIADRFEKLGLKPLGEKNSYFQPIRFKEQQVLSETSIRAGNETLKLGPDFYVSPPLTGEKSVGGQLVCCLRIDVEYT
jgi:hypothetical protein